MSRLPDREQEFLTWAAQHLTIWAGNGVPASIGVTPEQVAEAQLKLDSAQASLDVAESVRLDSVTKTADKDLKVGDLRTTMGGLVTQIDGYAKATADESVYVKASIPEPKPKTPRTEAPVPAMLALRSTTNGSLVLTFEANKGQGSVFVIQRRYETVDGVVSGFQYQDTTGEKAWTDDNVPGGLKWIGYQVATRLTNNVLSDWSDEKQFNFGTIGGTISGESPVDSGATLTIEDAQALQDAQTAKGKPLAG
ncbi:MAG: hypothetical protein AAFV77_06615 [Planctomycetota bacterium]